jgi:hypothetical protein
MMSYKLAQEKLTKLQKDTDREKTATEYSEDEWQ